MKSWQTRRVGVALLAACVGIACAGQVESEQGGSPVSLSDDGFTVEGNIIKNGWIKKPFAVGKDVESIAASLDWTDSSINLNLYLYDPSGNVVVYANKTAKPEQVSLDNPAPGEWAYAIRNKNKSKGTDYIVDIDFGLSQPPPPPPTDGVAVDGKINSNGWIKTPFEMPANVASVSGSLDWSDPGINLNFYLYDPSGKVVVYSNKSAKPETVRYDNPTPGPWFFAIKNGSGVASNYSVRIAFDGSDPAPAPTPTPTPTPSCTSDFPGNPKAGTVYWGSSVGGNSDPVARHEIPAGTTLPIRRTFFGWNHRTAYMINTARDDLNNGRLPWVSTKTPPWADMAAGKHDAEIDEMLRALDALGG
ncbi:MAG: hypothetical protein KC416_13160, partial [Myxococcales bacterium]|nr:hypothetical protein [Myxococcales bacterium]